MDTPLEMTRNVTALTQYWREKLRDGASVEELVDYLYDHGYSEIPINALKVICEASGLGLIEAVHVRDTVWSRRKGCVRTQNTRHLSPIIRLKTKANSPLNSKKNLHFKPRQHRFARLNSEF